MYFSYCYRKKNEWVKLIRKIYFSPKDNSKSFKTKKTVLTQEMQMNKLYAAYKKKLSFAPIIINTNSKKTF